MKLKTNMIEKVKVYPKFNSKIFNSKILNSKIFKTKNGRLMMQSKCPDCGFKKSGFVKEQVAKSLFSNLGIKTPLSKFPLLNVFF